jgi:nitrite reductase/ring-hydroxylating ferredoxin subunit
MGTDRISTDGVVLADGTRLEDLIDHDRRLLAARLWADPEVFELELAKVFARAWVPVAHVSEFKESGDFVTRNIGLDQVLVSMDASGDINVMLNACPHRGAPVCRSEEGNARTHTCSFHGWVFGADGKLMGAPYERLIYGERIDRASTGLRHARVEVMAGLVFANWDQDAPSLDEYIGDFKPYLELMLCRTDGGFEVTGPPQRFVVEANWKIVAEGFYGDVYHVPTVHKSLGDIGMMHLSEGTFQGYKVTVNGHGMQCPSHESHGVAGEPSEILATVPPVGMTPELVGQLDDHLSTEQIEMLAMTPPSIAGLFPASALVMVGGGLASTQITSLRFYVPLSPTETEIVNFTLAERDTSQEFKEALHTSTVSTFGVAGIFEADDTEVWADVQRSVRGVIGRQQLASYDATGTPCEPVLPGSPFTTRGVSGDENAWGFYERYMDFMEDRAW